MDDGRRRHQARQDVVADTLLDRPYRLSPLLRLGGADSLIGMSRADEGPVLRGIEYQPIVMLDPAVGMVFNAVINPERIAVFTAVFG